MNSLRQECKERLKIAFSDIRAINNALTFILVVDEIALKVLSNTIKMMELINYGITSVQRLQLNRKQFHKIEAVYLIHPSSYQKMLKDYAVSGKPQYNIVHVLTLTKIPMDIMNEIAQTTQLVKRMKSLKQINMNFNLHSHNELIIGATEQNIFNTTVHGSGGQYNTAVINAVDQLSTVLTSMSSFFLVQILYSKSNTTNFSEKVALGLKQKLQLQFKLYDKLQVENYSNGAPQTTFIILDRVFDAVSPLVRDFHYMPLLYEQKNIKNHTFTGKDKKIYHFDENDQIFKKYKNQHIAKATNISQDFKKFSTSQTVAKFQKNGEQMSMKDMAQIIKKMPQYSESKDKYAIHITMMSEIMQAFKQLNMKPLGQLEQTIITLVSENGKKLKASDVFPDIMAILSKCNDQYEKARILSIAFMCLQLKPKQLSVLIDQANKINDYSNIKEKINSMTGSTLYTLNNRKQKDDLILNRHIPKIEQIIKEIINGGQGGLKNLRVGSDSKSQKHTIKGNSVLGRKKLGYQNQKANKPRLIIFIASSIGYNQMRCLSQFQNQYHIIFASNNFVTPKQYLDLIDNLQI